MEEIEHKVALDDTNKHLRNPDKEAAAKEYFEGVYTSRFSEDGSQQFHIYKMHFDSKHQFWVIDEWRLEPKVGGKEGDTSDGGGNLVPRPALQAEPYTSPTPTAPVPKIDITEAEPGTSFGKEEATARSQGRQRMGLSGRGVAVQHPQPWREGRRTNTHPRITNHPDLLHPISNERGTGGTIGDKTYQTEHTYHDRGVYPREYEKANNSWWSKFVTDRVKSLAAGRRTRRSATGSGGPLFLKEYIVAPAMRGLTGQVALSATYSFVPLVAEAELGIMGAGYYLYGAGYTAAGTKLFLFGASVPALGGGLVAGALVGNAAESVASGLGLSDSVAVGVGAGSSVLAGAATGALIGSMIPLVGTGVGAAVGALGGLAGYAISKWL